MSKEIKKVKGEENGLCNRTACQSPVDVIFWNKSTEYWYCPICAEQIDAYIPQHDLDRLYGKGTKALLLTKDGLTPREYFRKEMSEMSETEIALSKVTETGATKGRCGRGRP